MENLKLDEIEKLPRDYLTVKEAAAVMGIACSTLYKNYLQMPFPVLRAGRSYRIPTKPFVEVLKRSPQGREGAVCGGSRA